MRKIKVIEAENELLKKQIKELEDIHKVIESTGDQLVKMRLELETMKERIKELEKPVEVKKEKPKATVVIPIKEVDDDGNVIISYKTPDQLKVR